jgi:chloramphenicol-sensitive protein RarD
MTTRQGVALSLFSSCLFGLMYYVSTRLAPLSGVEIFGWRMVFTWPIMTAFLIVGGMTGAISRGWLLVRLTFARLRHEPMLWAVLPASSALLGVQLWLFLWAPQAHHGLDVALGYFLLPLTMVLAGRIVYGEKLSPLLRAAVVAAAIGVIWEFVRVGRFSWPAALVALGYPVYFILRREYRTQHLGGLWFDQLLMLPVAVWFAFGLGSVTGVNPANSDAGLRVFAQHPMLMLWVPVLGFLSAIALLLYILASRGLPLGLLGLLGYVEPALLVLISLLLGERIEPGQWPIYIAIWVAIVFLLIEGMLRLREQKPVRK